MSIQWICIPMPHRRRPQGLHIYCVSHGSGMSWADMESLVPNGPNVRCDHNLSGAVPKLFWGVPFFTHQITEIGMEIREPGTWGHNLRCRVDNIPCGHIDDGPGKVKGLVGVGYYSTMIKRFTRFTVT